MNDTIYKPMLMSEVVADIYVEPHSKQFNTFCEGDMMDDTHTDDLIVALQNLPPGAKIVISYPCCPDCGMPREDKYEHSSGGIKIIGHEETCDCGFDWKEWVEMTYA